MTKNSLSELEEEYSLYSAFERNVQKNPHATALISRDQTISYYDLDVRASSLASQIVEYGLGAKRFIPILISRSSALVVSLLAVLKAGGIYTLIDPSWPKYRINKVIELLQPKIIITDDNLSSFNKFYVLSPFSECQKISQFHAAPTVDSFTPSTIFFTSGTTGEPKGVISTHKGVMRIFKKNSFAAFNPKTVIPLSAALPWDAFSLELWGALVNGGAAWIIDEPYLSSTALKKGISQHGVNTVWMTSSLFNMIVEEEIDSFLGLEQVIIGGERLSQSHVKDFLEFHSKIILINGYGPVETTIFATTHQISLKDCDTPAGIPIGIPVPQTEVFVLTEKMKLCADETLGQICIAGEGLAIGYLNDPILTGRKFKKVTIQGEEKQVYCTGDLGFWKNGLLYYQGRKDRQVKINGNRIELSEVEYQIKQHLKEIKSCRVICITDEEKHSHSLIAFCIPIDPSDTLKGARELLVSRLVSYQCPTEVVAINSFPLTAQGKLDEQELLKRHLKDKKEIVGTKIWEDGYNSIEELITKILALILKKESFSVNTTFRDFGLNSLDMGRLCSRLGKELQVSISLAKIYQYPTIASLSEFLSKNYKPLDQQMYVENDTNKMNPMQLIYLTQHLVNPSNLACRCIMTWFISGNLDIDSLKKAIVQVHVNNKALSSKYLPEFNLNEVAEAIFPPSLKMLPTQQTKEAAIASLRFEFSKDLDPSIGKIWRTAIVPLAQANTYIFGCVIHHIAFDGYSEHLLAESLSEAYNRPLNIVNNSNNYNQLNSTLTPLQSVSDLSEEAKELAKTLEKVPELIWPDKSEKKSDNASTAAEYTISILKSQADFIEEFSIESGISGFELLFYAWVYSLNAITGQVDFCVGIPVRQRNHSKIDSTIGCHLNMICLRMTKKIFENNVSGVQEASYILQKSLANQEIPFSQILQIIRPLQTGRAPLFQTLFAFQDNPVPRLELAGLKTEFIRQPYLDLPLELHAEIWPEENGSLRFVISYRLDCVSRTVVENLAKHFKKRLEEILDERNP